MVKKKNISIKEIAKLADVSVATVSRVIKNMVILLILPPKAYGHQNQKQSD